MPWCALLAAMVLCMIAAPAEAQLLPGGFLDNQPQIGNDNVAVTSERLTYNGNTKQVLADGHVEVDYNGYVITGEHLVFDQRTHVAHFVGDVVVVAPDKNVYRAPDMVLSGPMHDALARELTITTPEGALITAGNGDLQQGKQVSLDDGTYAPCGVCIDAKGHRIGWSAKYTRMVYDNKTYNITLTKPSLYLLGIPVAWLPWLTVPDPTKRLTTFHFPSIVASANLGYGVNIPYFIPDGLDTDILLTATPLSRQGLLLSGEVDHRFSNGAIKVQASGIYQRDPSAFAPYTGGDRNWRGEVSASGQFRPIKDWTVGFSYSVFSDPGYLTDYQLSAATSSTNEVYATKLTREEFLNFRLQQFNVLGDYPEGSQEIAAGQQAVALPNATYGNLFYLPGDKGEIDLSGTLLGAKRDSDATRSIIGGVPYTFGYAETKAHATGEVDWQKQYITPGGFAVTPYAGLRTDAASYNGASSFDPGQQELFNATPIAAVDVRFPMIARTGWATHIVEPIAQLVYRASDTTDVGITNDTAQSFVFQDTNLFSYNRFSGTDRQETGLRANLGAHYQANFDNGGWLDLIGGESFQLAGLNAFDAPDPTQVTTGQGLSSPASYVVLGAQGSVIPGLSNGAKLQVDPTAGKITQAGVGSNYRIGSYDFSLDYLYVAANPDRGVLTDQHEVVAGVTLPVPFVDYWTANVYGGWDIAANKWLVAGGGAHYDDGYLTYGADIQAYGPTNVNASTGVAFSATLGLKGLNGGKF
jgi:LPS-assembly protein